MSNGIVTTSLFVALVVAFPASATADDAPIKRDLRLKVGDPAPALSIKEWVKGSPVAAFEKDKAYVIEFWATWCGPCISSMPHLSEIQKRFGKDGLTIIGVTSTDRRNSLDEVKKMVGKKGDIMSYTVAWDDGRKTNNAWMKAANQSGIPCSFVVDKNGRIASIGHPMWLEIPVAGVVAGTWTLDAAEKRQKAEVDLRKVRAREKTDPKAALKTLEEITASYPSIGEKYDLTRIRLYLANGRFDDASALGRRRLEKALAEENTGELNSIAWSIVDPKKEFAKRDLTLALEAAEAASKLTDNKNAPILDTLARVHFSKGDLKKAVDLQRQAVRHARGNRLKNELSEILQEYHKAAGIESTDPAELPFVRKTHTYKTVGKTKIQADVYRAVDETPRPVVVYIHGGALINGHRKQVLTQIRELCREEGAILVSIDYRLAPEVRIGAIIDDVKDAFRWIREKGPTLFNADARRLIVAGSSAGGYLTLMAGACVTPRPTALVSYWGYGDVDGKWYTKPSEHYRSAGPLITEDEVKGAVSDEAIPETDVLNPTTRKVRSRYYLYLRQNGLWTKTVTGFDPETQKAQLDPFCPARNVTPDFPPTLLVHGTDDNDVPYSKSVDMAKAFERHNVPHELVTVKNAGHGLSRCGKEERKSAHERAL